jgi:hypothetical protein
MRMRTWMWLVVACTGCLRSTAYKCETSDQCGTGGVCEATQYCSFADPDCGRRYGAQAGAYANQCVGGSGIDSGIGIDAANGSDAPAIDAPAACPGDFVTLTGAPAGRTYKLITAAANWPAQKAACVNLSARAYLAFPQDAAELTAMDTLAASNNTYWVGIDDLPPATTFVTVKGANATFLPWQGGSPSSNPNDQCVEALTQSATLLNDRCNHTFPAICACE